MINDEAYKIEELKTKVRSDLKELQSTLATLNNEIQREMSEITKRLHDFLPEQEPEVFIRGDLSVDKLAHRISWKGKNITFTATEFSIVDLMSARPDWLVNRDYMLDAFNLGGCDRAIDAHIKKVRKKFKEVDPEFNKIITLHKEGYRWNQ